MRRNTFRPIVFLMVVWTLLFAARLTHGGPYKADAGPYEVAVFLMDLRDAQRDREVPIKVYMPADRGDGWPVVLVSHGLGGSREGLSYLGNHWASHGYVCVHMQHPGSDEAVWRDVPLKDRMRAMRNAARDPQAAIDRAEDVPFVLDQLTALNKQQGSRLFARLELKEVGIAGHSFGAWSAMAAGGMTVGGKLGRSFADERIKCIIPLSPPVTKRRQREAAYRTLNVPALFMTGTLDTSPINDTTAKQRQIPYRLMPGVSDNGEPKYMINFDGADHMTFSGETRRARRFRKADPDADPVFHGLILQVTTAFLDAYLLGDDAATRWLNGGALVQTVGERGEVSLDAE